MTDRIPRPFDLGNPVASSIGGVLHHAKYMRDDAEYYNPLNRPLMMGYVLPTFQRGLVWTEAQKIRFIESAWMGMPLGTYSYNSYGVGKDDPNVRNLLIDGQQRLSALQDYVANMFPVLGLLYDDLTKPEKRRFDAISFHSFEVRSDDEVFLREYYNRLNFGGTAHKEGEQA